MAQAFDRPDVLTTPLCAQEYSKINAITTKSNGTVHTSDKARFTSVAISVPPSGESVPDKVVDFPYLPG